MSARDSENECETESDDESTFSCSVDAMYCFTPQNVCVETNHIFMNYSRFLGVIKHGITPYMTHITPCRNVINIEYTASAGFEVFTVWFKTCTCTLFTNFQRTKFFFFFFKISA